MPRDEHLRVAFALLLGTVACSSGGDNCGSEALSLNGAVELFFGPVTFDTVSADLVHRRDVDEWEDRVVTKVQLHLSIGGQCKLEVLAEGCPDAADRLPVKLVTFSGDAHCPGLPQEQEGLYVSGEPKGLGFVDIGSGLVPDRDAKSSCFNSHMTLDLQGDLTAQTTGAVVTIPHSSAAISGDFTSRGDYGAAAQCGAVIGGGDATDEGDTVVETLSDDALAVPEVPDGPKCMVRLKIACPDCTSTAAVRVIAATGWTIGQPELVYVLDAPVLFPLDKQIDEAMDPSGSPAYFPADDVTFMAWQDTTAGGMTAEQGEPVSKLVTVKLAEGQITTVSLDLEPDATPVVTCTPGENACLSVKVSGLCNETGDAWESTSCPESQACNEQTGACAGVVCSPSSKACADGTSIHECLPSGTGWLPKQACGEGFSCVNGSCMDQECITQVMFLVDISGSMVVNWEAVSASVAKLGAMSPTASFGMWVFPKYVSSGCDVPPAPELEPKPNQGAALQQWFLDNDPFGLTPLVDAMKTVSTSLPAVFAGGMGTLVVLSDGADTCAYPMMTDQVAREELIIQDLATATKSLNEQNGIKTYVIAYNFVEQSKTGELIAIAENGGTGKTTYIEAGSEMELMSALVGIGQDIKLCFEQE